MLDPKLLRENPDLVRQDLRRRGMPDRVPLVDQAIEDDREWRRLKKMVEDLRHKQNQLTAEVSNLKKKGQDIRDKLEEVKGIPEEIRRLESEASTRSANLEQKLMGFPNILHQSVPAGKDENDNVTERTWGEKTEFDFTPKDHIDILTNLGMVDMERAAKVSGARFFFLKGDAVRLEHSIMRYAVDFMSSRNFTPVEPPFMMGKTPYEGVVDLSSFGPVVYKVEGEDLYLIATSEHPLVAMHMDEILETSVLPLRYCGFSPCFRVEAGAHGRDTKGIFRTHQFYKVEQVVFSKQEDSWRIHEELIANAESVFRSLKIPHRVVTLCSADTGTTSAKTYDLEAWMPTQGTYREMVSSSNVTDYQARRLKIRYRDRPGGETRLAHTLNSTVVTTRALVAIVENFQQGDGSVRIPEPLVPYMGGVETLGSR